MNLSTAVTCVQSFEERIIRLSMIVALSIDTIEFSSHRQSCLRFLCRSCCLLWYYIWESGKSDSKKFKLWIAAWLWWGGRLWLPEPELFRFDGKEPRVGVDRTLLFHFVSSPGNEFRLEVVMIRSFQNFGVFRFTGERLVMADGESVIDRMAQFMGETEGGVSLMLVSIQSGVAEERVILGWHLPFRKGLVAWCADTDRWWTELWEQHFICPSSIFRFEPCKDPVPVIYIHSGWRGPQGRTGSRGCGFYPSEPGCGCFPRPQSWCCGGRRRGWCWIASEGS